MPAGKGLPPKAYRDCVGITLFNRDGLVWLGQRADRGEAAWQMPQGGIDQGESTQAAAMRELHEEIGSKRAVIIAEAPRWYRYDFPAGARRGRYRGQRQRWFAMLHTAADDIFDLTIHRPQEFIDWRWVDLDQAVALIVAFKRPVYRAVADGFADLPARIRNGAFSDHLPTGA